MPPRCGVCLRPAFQRTPRGPSPGPLQSSKPGGFPPAQAPTLCGPEPEAPVPVSSSLRPTPAGGGERSLGPTGDRAASCGTVGRRGPGREHWDAGTRRRGHDAGTGVGGVPGNREPKSRAPAVCRTGGTGGSHSSVADTHLPCDVTDTRKLRNKAEARGGNGTQTTRGS